MVSGCFSVLRSYYICFRRTMRRYLRDKQSIAVCAPRLQAGVAARQYQAAEFNRNFPRELQVAGGLDRVESNGDKTTWWRY